MIGKLYTAKNGTPHVVHVLDVVREFTKGEKMENTAITEQVLLQRQKQESIARWTFYVDDLSYPKFTMQLETFLEEYKEIDSPEQENFGEMLQNIFRDKTPNEVPDKIKTNIKMRVTPEQSAKVQEIIFKNGGSWQGGDTNIEATDIPFLYLKGKSLLTRSRDCNYFNASSLSKVDADLFIRTNGTCEENKLCGSEELKTIKDTLEEIEPSSAYNFNDFEFVEDNPVSPSHYKIGGIETIDYIAAKLTPEEFKGYCKGNTIKHLSRAGHKGREVEDYKKAAWYLDKLIGVLNEIH